MNSPDLRAELLAESAWVRRLARRLVRDAHTAEDLAQEVMVAVLQQPPRATTNLRGWLHTVLRHLAGRQRRRERSSALRELAVARAEASIDGGSHQRLQLHRRLVEHVEALPEPYRSTIVLRFLDGLPPRRIAQRLGVPTNTVRSRVQRGLALLRDRLDGGPDGRDGWLAGVAAIGWPTLAGGTASGSAIGVLLLMHGKLFGGLAAAVLVGLFLWLGSDAPARDAVDPASASKVARAPTRGANSSDGGSAAAGEVAAAPSGDARQVAAVPDDVAPAPQRAGRVVDLAGHPVAGARVALHGRVWPRWQGGDLGWINDGEQTRFVPPDQLAALRKDPALATRFFAELEHAAVWRTVLLGEPLAGHEIAAAADGTFAFPATADDSALDLVDPQWLLLAELRDATGTLLVAAPRIAVGGRAIDQEGRPLPAAQVAVHWTAAAALAGRPDQLRTWEPPTLRVDAEGRYLLPEVAAGVPGAELVATCPGRRDARAPVPWQTTEALDLVLWSATDEAIGCSGRVVDERDAPIDGAQVCFGDDTARTDAAGRFAFASLPAEDHASLTVLARGHAPLQQLAFADDLRADPRRGRDLVLKLDPAHTLRGSVTGPDGRPLADARVNLFDPTLLDFSFTPAEGRLGGWERGAATDRDGHFELGGAALRPYRLRVWRPDTALCFVTESFPAGATDLAVQIPADSLHAVVHGRVVAAGGALPADLRIAVVYPIHIIKRGDGCMTDGTAPIGVGRDGTFTLRLVPRRFAWLALSAPTLGTVSTPVEAIGDDGAIEIACAPARMLQLLCYGEGGGSISVLDADDRALPIEIERAGRRERTFELVREPHGFPPGRIAATATTVLLRRTDGSWQRAPILDDAGGIARAVLRW